MEAGVDGGVVGGEADGLLVVVDFEVAFVVLGVDGDVVDGGVVNEDPGSSVECGAVIEFSTYAAVAIAYNICIHGMAKAAVAATFIFKTEVVD